jgi:hypothetical protein
MRLEQRNRHKEFSSGNLPRTAGSPGFQALSALVGGVVVVVAVLYFLLFSSYGPGIALSPGQRVYAKCMREIGGKMKNMEKIKIPEHKLQGMGQAGAAFAEGMTGMMQGMMGGFAEGMCVVMKEECDRDPNGHKCKTLLKTL